jgi:DNA-binding transcriptional LysR family regulator
MSAAVLRVTLRQLQVFAAAVRTGSFAAAAQDVGLTPPAVTLQLKELEKAAGLALFERHGRKQTLTQAGEQLLLCAQRVHDAIDGCSVALAELKGLHRGLITIGAVSTAKYFVPRILAAFADRHPGIDIRVQIAARETIVATLAEGGIDLAIMGRPPDGLAVHTSVIGDHPYVIVAAPDRALGRAALLGPRALEAETFLVREPGSGTRTLMEQFFARAGIAPRIGMEISSNETIKQAVMAGLGLAFISGHTIAAEIEDGRLAVLPVGGLPVLRQWFVVRPARKPLSPPAAALAEFAVTKGPGFLPTVPGAGVLSVVGV